MNNKKKVIHPLAPIYDENCQILILGSLPSVKSREENFFYAHPQNRFWKVLAHIFNESLPITNEQKTDFLLRHHIALWDVIHSCYICGSSDASISNVKVNQLFPLIRKTKIKTIFTTGATAQKYYNKYCYSKTKIPSIQLPSTSPTNAAYSLEQLITAYQIILDFIKQ